MSLGQAVSDGFANYANVSGAHRTQRLLVVGLVHGRHVDIGFRRR